MKLKDIHLHPLTFNCSHVDQTLSTLTLVTVEEVYYLIGSLSVKSSPASSLKSGIEVFCKVIAQLVNISFSQGTFPELKKTHEDIFQI